MPNPHSQLPNGKFGVTPKDDSRDRIVVEVGDTKQPGQFFPQTKIQRWDDEVNVSIRHINHGENNPTVTQEGDRVKWKGSKREAHFYELPVSQALPDGGTEIEIVLLEKPTSNNIEFSIASKGVQFIYQPALTQAEIDAGAVRPDNIVGSYAIYCSTEKVNTTTGKLYRSGKVGHIYRPWIVDANGNGTWGDLSISVNGQSGNGTLTVTIPQAFLDGAAYPVRHAAGLTLGYNSFPNSQFTIVADGVALCAGTAAASGAVTQVNFAAGGAGGSSGGHAKGVIFKVSDGTVITNGVTPAVVPQGFGFTACPYSTQPSVVNGTAYYVGTVFDASNDIGYDTGSAGDGGESSNSYSSPTTLGTINNSTRKYGIYATYALPSITETGTLSDFGNVAVGSQSSEQTFTVAGSNLTANLVVTAPTHFEVSTTSGSGFGSSVTLTQSGGSVSTTTIYAHFKPTSAGAKSGNITLTSTGATTVNVAVAGTGTSSSPPKMINQAVKRASYY